MNGRTDSRTRSLLLLGVIALAGFACIARLGYWQILDHDALAARARGQVTAQITETPIRGSIYDRNGAAVLATSVERDRLVGYPAQVKGTTDAETAAKRATLGNHLVAILGLAPDAADALRAQLATGNAYVTLARGLTPDQSAAIRSALDRRDISQVDLETDYQRVYPTDGGAPKTTLAAQLLGFVNADGDGQYGVEAKWQQVLAGTPEVISAQLDGAGRPTVESGSILSQGTAGQDIHLTIDGSLQLKLEQEIYTAWVANKAKSVSAIVMDPTTGEILASATYPSYDANAYRTTATRNPGAFVDPTISAVYEPGSVFKLLTAAAALNAGVVTRTTMISDQAVLKLDGGRESVRNADLRSRGLRTFENHVAYSRNVVMSKVALRLGPTTRRAASVLYGMWKNLGIGQTTGMDVAGEVPGIVRDPALSDWAQIDLANASFGQGVAVTLMQLARAYSAMVNGGLLPNPHVVKAVGDAPVPVAPAARVMTPALSKNLIGIMESVVNSVPFYAARTLIPGYLVGGKTGTAQIWDAAKKQWRTDAYNFTFAGFVGRKAPELTIVVRINEGHPLVNRSGNIINAIESFELFRRIATDAMSTLGLPPVTQAKAGAHASKAASGSSAAATPAAATPATPKRTPAPGDTATNPAATPSAGPRRVIRRVTRRRPAGAGGRPPDRGRRPVRDSRP